MIDSPLVGWLNGVYIRTSEASLVIDPSTSRPPRDAVVLISHAHADHTKGFSSPNIKISTFETKRIHEALTCRRVDNFRELYFNSPIRIGDVEVEAVNSGHMIGAAQFKISTPESVILYTGDINYVDSLLSKAAEPEKCDLLIMEATYGTPIYNFPARTNTYSNMVKWALDEIKCGRIPCFRVYASGKAQEIVKLFNTYTKVSVITDNRINLVNAVCEDRGLKLRWKNVEHEPEELGVPIIYLSSNRHYVRGIFSEARATGWSLRIRSSKVITFPLSGHADFNHLCKFAEDTGARRVHIFTGFIDEFSEYLTRKGIRTTPIPLISQRDLWNYT